LALGALPKNVKVTGKQTETTKGTGGGGEVIPRGEQRVLKIAKMRLERKVVHNKKSPKGRHYGEIKPSSHKIWEEGGG